MKYTAFKLVGCPFLMWFESKNIVAVGGSYSCTNGWGRGGESVNAYFTSKSIEYKITSDKLAYE